MKPLNEIEISEENIIKEDYIASDDDIELAATIVSEILTQELFEEENNQD